MVNFPSIQVMTRYGDELWDDPGSYVKKLFHSFLCRAVRSMQRRKPVREEMKVN